LVVAQIRPAVTSNESPGRKKPISRPVSTNTITFMVMKAAMAYSGRPRISSRPRLLKRLAKSCSRKLASSLPVAGAAVSASAGVAS
jgi:hypothetical protein